jgi:hypothetical protein
LTLWIKEATAKIKRSDLRKGFVAVLGGSEFRDAIWR